MRPACFDPLAPRPVPEAAPILPPPKHYVRITRGIKRVHIDAHVYNSIRGYIVAGGRTYPNRLLQNFYKLLWGIFTDAAQYMKATNGGNYPIRVHSDVSWGKPEIYACQETEELAFDAYTCASNSSCYSVGVVQDGGCIEYGCTVGTGGNSILAAFRLFGTDVSRWFIAMAHRILSVADNQTVKHRICFAQPWLKYMASIIGAIACDCNDFTASDLSGQNFNIRGHSELVAGPAGIVVVSGGNLLDTTMFRSAHITADYAYFYLTGLIIPSETIVAEKIYLTANIWDTGGTGRHVPVLEIASDVTLEGGKLHSIGVHIIGG